MRTKLYDLSVKFEFINYRVEAIHVEIEIAHVDCLCVSTKTNADLMTVKSFCPFSDLSQTWDNLLLHAECNNNWHTICHYMLVF